MLLMEKLQYIISKINQALSRFHFFTSWLSLSIFWHGRAWIQSGDVRFLCPAVLRSIPPFHIVCSGYRKYSFPFNVFYVFFCSSPSINNDRSLRKISEQCRSQTRWRGTVIMPYRQTNTKCTQAKTNNISPNMHDTLESKHFSFFDK